MPTVTGWNDCEKKPILSSSEKSNLNERRIDSGWEKKNYIQS